VRQLRSMHESEFRPRF